MYLASRLLAAFLAVAPLGVPSVSAEARGLSDEAQAQRYAAVGRLNIGGQGHCTATLIAPDLALTAAHCLVNRRTGATWRAERLTFLPGYFFAVNPIEGGIIHHHRLMLDLQTQVLRPHPYQSTWPDWVLNWRAIWYLYEPVDGAQRGVILIGNPLTMLLGLPALAWCAWQGLSRKAAAHGGVALLYAISLGFWIFAAKPVQFYYHYFLPSTFLLVALALALDDMRQAGLKWAANTVLAASLGVFAFYYVVLAAEPLSEPDSFRIWTWLQSWV